MPERKPAYPRMMTLRVESAADDATLRELKRLCQHKTASGAFWHAARRVPGLVEQVSALEAELNRAQLLLRELERARRARQEAVDALEGAVARVRSVLARRVPETRDAGL